MTAPAETTIELMLVSHTNVGKTSLLRTLLGRDVGRVADAPDVTLQSAPHELARIDGATLRLWDTPGFGDSFRLAARLRRRPAWAAWIVREVWDRRRNPRLHRAQQLARDLRARAHVVLYLVDASQTPEEAVHVGPELEALAWAGKPLLAILNQTGMRSDASEPDSRAARWRTVLEAHPAVGRTVELDSFSRCWVQEIALYAEVGGLLDASLHPVYSRLSAGIADAHRQRFSRSMTALADHLAATACDRIEVGSSVFGALRRFIPWSGAADLGGQREAFERLTRTCLDGTQKATLDLLEINRISGTHAGEILEATVRDLTVSQPVDTASSSLLGGVLSGAVTGLAADLMAGGLTLGTGALVGAVLGGAGAAALTAGYNRYAEKDRTIIRWSPASLDQTLRSTVMLYLAVAHFGRGQGEWRHHDTPARWGREVDAAIARAGERRDHLWKLALDPGRGAEVRTGCETLLRDVVGAVLDRLYPEAGTTFPGSAASHGEGRTGPDQSHQG